MGMRASIIAADPAVPGTPDRECRGLRPPRRYQGDAGRLPDDPDREVAAGSDRGFDESPHLAGAAVRFIPHSEPRPGGKTGPAADRKRSPLNSCQSDSLARVQSPPTTAPPPV